MNFRPERPILCRLDNFWLYQNFESVKLPTYYYDISFNEND